VKDERAVSVGCDFHLCGLCEGNKNVKFEVFTAVTMKNGVFWDVAPSGSCKN
jgi:hypothetical protein